MMPFLVADRPASLQIIRGSRIVNYNIKVGIMTHANTSDNFHLLFAQYPCAFRQYCEIIQKKCPNDDIEQCDQGLKIKNRIEKICDSGIFQKNVNPIEYSTLFSIYDQMKTDYGVINDVVKNKDLTIESAKMALDEYDNETRNFKLVGVSQGNSLEEYIECYEELKKLGYKYIAVGGLLKKRENSVRYLTVGNEDLLKKVVFELRNKYSSDWIYLLGCYHINRHTFLSKNKIYGSDYKGWIFQYDIGKGKKSKIEASNKNGRRRSRYMQVRNFLNSIYFLTEKNNNEYKPIHYSLPK